jgi:hypothetical protein
MVTNNYCFFKELQELHIDLSNLLNDDCKLILTSWSHQIGISWSLHFSEKECHESGLEDLEFPSWENLPAPWIQRIPVQVINVLKQYKRNAWGMLMIVSRHGSALKLLLNFPLLFWMLYRYAVDNGWAEALFVSCCELSFVDILNAIALPCDEASVSVLKKIYAVNFAQHQYAIIRQLLESDCNALDQLDIIDEDLIRFLLRYPDYRCSPLIRDWHKDKRQLLLQLVQSIQQLSSDLGLGDAVMQRIYKSNDLIALKALKNELYAAKTARAIAEYEMQRGGDSGACVELYQSTLIESDIIRAIKSSVQLYDESKLLDHHLISFADRIKAGQYAAYSVLAPERATLLIILFKSRDDAVIHVITELVTFNGCAVSDETVKAVNDWLIAN